MRGRSRVPAELSFADESILVPRSTNHVLPNRIKTENGSPREIVDRKTPRGSSAGRVGKKSPREMMSRGVRLRGDAVELDVRMCGFILRERRSGFEFAR